MFSAKEMVKLRVVALFLNYLSTFILVVALAIGLVVCWSHDEESSTIVVAFAFLSIFVFAVCLALWLYFSFVSVSRVIFHIWIGCLMGVVSFTENPEYERETNVQIMNALFLTSLGLKCFWHLVQRLLKLLDHKPIILSKSEFFELVGIAIPTLWTSSHNFSLTFFVISIGILCFSIRLKSTLGVLNLVLFTCISFLHIFPKLNLHINVFCLASFIGRVTIEALLDHYFSPLSMLEHWQAFLRQTSCTRRLTIIVIMCLELSYCAKTATLMPGHKEWLIVVPIFIAFALLWLSFHILFVISFWKLMNRITDCYLTYNSLSAENRNFNCIMASKGVRHFCLVIDRLILLTCASTILIGAIGWTTKTLLNIGLFMIVFPIECMVYSLVLEMGSSLGGTCTGYALVAPVSLHRSTTGDVTILPLNKVEEISSRSTQILNIVQSFFTFHLISNFGCDYSSSGISSESLGPKIQAFFDRCTSDGPRFDTYLIYYSGAVHDNGDLALAGNGTLSLYTLVEWWRERNTESGARLILIMDTKQSVNWIKQMKSECKQDFIAIQTLDIKKSTDIESGDEFAVGDFTKMFFQYNTKMVEHVDWSGADLCFKAVYGTSRCWADFAFHFPTHEDMSQHWHQYFPKFTIPLMILATCGRNNELFCCSSCLLRCLRRKKLRWFPPSELDTGHGFKLIRS